MDAINGLIEKYRYADKKYQIIIPIVIGALLGYYLYSSALPSAQEELSSVQTAMESAKKQFDETKAKKDKIQNLSEELSRAEAELADLSKRLPNEVDIDLVLESLAKTAIKVGINIATIEPQAQAAPAAPNNQPAGRKNQAAKPESVKSFTENLVKISISGRFANTVKFFDELLHFERVVNINNIRMTSVLDQDALGSDDAGVPLARRQRDSVYINTTFELITYRSMI